MGWWYSQCFVGADVSAAAEFRTRNGGAAGRQALSETKKFYSSVKLKTTADGENTQPDIVVHGGYGYELVSAFDNQSGVINHYKYIGIKIFKVGATSDWTNGTLKRP